MRRTLRVRAIVRIAVFGLAGALMFLGLPLLISLFAALVGGMLMVHLSGELQRDALLLVSVAVFAAVALGLMAFDSRTRRISGLCWSLADCLTSWRCECNSQSKKARQRVP